MFEVVVFKPLARGRMKAVAKLTKPVSRSAPTRQVGRQDRTDSVLLIKTCWLNLS